jgi:hypothetical protein
LPFNPWAILAMSSHIGAPKKYEKNEITIHFEQKFTMGSYEVEFGFIWMPYEKVKIFLKFQL